MRRFVLLFLVSSIFLAAGCGGSGPPVQLLPEPAADSIDVSLFLIGDAGESDERGDPVLIALTREVREHAAPSWVVFLGDNVYPKGLPAPDHPDFDEMARRLDAQVNAVLATDSPGVLVPGNHDWERSGRNGWDAVRRQGRRVEETGEGRVQLLPREGCPGPEVIDIGSRLRLVLIDTEWWLRGDDKPVEGDPACPHASEQGVLDSLEVVLATAGNRHVVVAGHHPLASSGPHGGHFTVKDHLFPLTVIKPWLYLPLPVIGSLYPLSRNTFGITEQDMDGGKNQHMRASLESVFVKHPPLLYTNGHEHALELMRGDSARYYATSGSGYFGHIDTMGRSDRTLFVDGVSGFMRMDVLLDGAVRLSVLEVLEDASIRERYSLLIAEPSAPGPAD